MLTHFERPEESKELYFKLNSSFQIIESECSSTYKHSGLYALYKGGICYYVGQTKNLASRLSQHVFGKYESIDKIYIFSPYVKEGVAPFYDQPASVRKKMLEQNEMILMGILKPIENLITPPDDFEPDDDYTWHSMSYGFYDEFISEMTSMSINVDKYYISVSQGDGESYCDFSGSVFRQHNEYVVQVYSNFGDEAFEKGMI